MTDTAPAITIESLGFNPVNFDIGPNEILQPVGIGFNSRAYLLPELGSVIKICDGRDENRAIVLHGAMTEEHELAVSFLPEHTPFTSLKIVRNETTGESHIATVQNYISGLAIKEALARGAVDMPAFRNLLAKGRLSFSTTGKIPDMACVEHGFFDPFQSPNIIVSDNGFPWLVDTTFGKLQRSSLFGKLWNVSIARGVSKAIVKSRK